MRRSPGKRPNEGHGRKTSARPGAHADRASTPLPAECYPQKSTSTDSLAWRTPFFLLNSCSSIGILAGGRRQAVLSHGYGDILAGEPPSRPGAAGGDVEI